MESDQLLRRLLGLLGGITGPLQPQPQPQPQAQGAGAGAYSNNSGGGTIGSFNSGGGSQNFQGAKINSGAYSGDGNTFPRYDNYGGNLIHNSGFTNGNGNGSIVFGGLDSSTNKNMNTH